jgi:hypothetical protein
VDPYLERHDPNVELSKPVFERLFLILEELLGLGRIFDINKLPDIFILKPLSLLQPDGVNDLGEETDCAEACGQLAVNEKKLLRFDRCAVVIPCGQKNFEASVGHRPGLASGARDKGYSVPGARRAQGWER